MTVVGMDQIARIRAAFVQRKMTVITPTAVALGVVRKVLLGTTALQVSVVFNNICQNIFDTPLLLLEQKYLYNQTMLIYLV